MRSTRALFARSLRRAPLYISLLAILGLAMTPIASAATPSSTEGFSVQVSPSPLVGTITPGKTSTFDLQVRNTGTQPQSLKMGLKAFSVDGTTGKVDLKNTAPDVVKDFVSFSSPTFGVAAGEIFTQHIKVATPSTAGFTYSFAIVISQQNPPKQSGQSSIQGSVAVFTLLSVDRPDATSKLQLEQVTVSRHVYEYLPASITVKLKNTGNTLVQPRGNVYIQRHVTDTQPIAVIDLNKNAGYILPDSSRSITEEWQDGFPHYESVTNSAGKTENKLVWEGGDFSKLRFGKYVAKVVAVYNDDGRDVPLEADITFWVIPWRFILILLLIVGICLVGLFTILRKSGKALKRPYTHKNDRKKGQDATKN